MHEVLALSQRLLGCARRLQRLTTHLNSELSMAELVVLADLNEEFQRTMRDIEHETRLTADRLHDYVLARGLLAKGYDARSGTERRVGPERRT
jgi:hypothetical protein